MAWQNPPCPFGDAPIECNENKPLSEGRARHNHQKDKNLSSMPGARHKYRPRRKSSSPTRASHGRATFACCIHSYMQAKLTLTTRPAWLQQLADLQSGVIIHRFTRPRLFSHRCPHPPLHPSPPLMEARSAWKKAPCRLQRTTHLHSVRCRVRYGIW